MTDKLREVAQQLIKAWDKDTASYPSTLVDAVNVALLLRS
jgi:hypothetical protein